MNIRRLIFWVCIIWAFYTLQLGLYTMRLRRCHAFRSVHTSGWAVKTGCKTRAYNHYSSCSLFGFICLFGLFVNRIASWICFKTSTTFVQLFRLCASFFVFLLLLWTHSNIWWYNQYFHRNDYDNFVIHTFLLPIFLLLFNPCKWNIISSNVFRMASCH